MTSVCLAEASGKTAVTILSLDTARSAHQVRFAHHLPVLLAGQCIRRHRQYAAPWQVQTKSHDAACIHGPGQLQERQNRFPGRSLGQGLIVALGPGSSIRFTYSYTHAPRCTRRSWTCWRRPLLKCTSVLNLITRCSRRSWPAS